MNTAKSINKTWKITQTIMQPTNQPNQAQMNRTINQTKHE